MIYKGIILWDDKGKYFVAKKVSGKYAIYKLADDIGSHFERKMREAINWVQFPSSVYATKDFEGFAEKIITDPEKATLIKDGLSASEFIKYWALV